MNSLSPRTVVHMWAAAYNKHDADAAAALYDEHVTNLQLPWGEPVQGCDAMKATYHKVFEAFPDIHVEIVNVMEDGQWVAVEWRFSGTMRGSFAGHPPNNSTFSLRGCEVFRIADGRILVQHGYWDKATMLTQLNCKPDV